MPLLSVIAVMAALPPTVSIADREQDWRIGPVVYQVFVDRFAPPKDLEAKRAIIRPPRVLKTWKDLPTSGKPVPSLGVYSHELDFWGGDFAGLRSHLDYVDKLGADVLYLNPIHKAFTNHKYDAEDYALIDPQFGTQQDFDGLIQDVHRHDMKLMLDGVFNHMGKRSTLFENATAPDGKHRDWFYFDKKYENGYRSFAGAANLPELNLENPEVRNYLWSSPTSIVQKYLKEGVDGWRLDVAFQLGPDFLDQITRAAHAAKAGSDVVGEISGYPSDWFPAVDGVYNFYSMGLVRETLEGKMNGGRAGLALNHLVLDAGIEHLLRSWLITDNHDTDRFANQVPSIATRKIIWAMQMCLPGSPMIYYGSELGMQGAGDPENRAPMRWDLVNDGNENLSWIKKMIRIRKASPALRYGDFQALDTSDLLAFMRTTDKVLDTRLVVMNPTDAPVKESFGTRTGRLMSWGDFKDTLTGERIRTVNGLITVSVPPKTVRIYTADPNESHGYSPYHRIP